MLRGSVQTGHGKRCASAAAVVESGTCVTVIEILEPGFETEGCAHYQLMRSCAHGFRGIAAERITFFRRMKRLNPLMSAKSKERRTSRKKGLDDVSAKAPRGRPPRVDAPAIRSRADYYRVAFARVWDRTRTALICANKEEDIVKAVIGLQESGNDVEARLIAWLAPHLLRVLRDPKFPTQTRAQINFLADSVAAHGIVSSRRARDICGRQRSEKPAHYIRRIEYYIECSCGYSGPSRDHACPKCGAQLPFDRW
jgi:hypothetical protein